MKTKKKPTPRIAGTLVKIQPLDSVKPNGWNFNEFTPFMRESLRQGLQTDGWLVSQALLIWGTDEKGRRQNIIIDGEHRWTEARALGFQEGPMVYLERITETEAKALTVKMNHKHGEQDEDRLAAIVRAVQYTVQGDLGLDLGIDKAELTRYLTVPQVAPKATSSAAIPSTSMKMVQLYFDEASHQEFTKLVKALAPKFKTENVTDTTMEIVRRAHSTANAGR